MITEIDLTNYKPQWRKPLISNYRDNKIITMGPPSSGGIHIIQMLNILENYDLKLIGHNTVDYINLLAEVMKYAYADRSKHLGDPDFFAVPISEITNKKYAKVLKIKLKLVNQHHHQKYYQVHLRKMKVLKQLIFQWLIEMEILYRQPIL